MASKGELENRPHNHERKILWSVYIGVFISAAYLLIAGNPDLWQTWIWFATIIVFSTCYLLFGPKSKKRDKS